MTYERKTSKLGQRRNQKRRKMERNETEDTADQNLGDAVKAVLRGKFTVVNVYINEEQRS